jgi:hypothetical protein
MPKAIEVFNVNNRLLLYPAIVNQELFTMNVYLAMLLLHFDSSRRIVIMRLKKYYDLFHCLGFKFENSTSLRLLWRYLAMFALILQKALLRKDERACYYHYYQKIKNVE